MSDERIEWGVRLTWPDGDFLVLSRSSEKDAKATADWHTRNRSVAAPGIVKRRVTVGDWETA